MFYLLRLYINFMTPVHVANSVVFRHHAIY